MTGTQTGGTGTAAALVALLCVWLQLTGAAHAHEIRPVIATIVFGEDRAFELELSLNLEARLAGIDAQHRDTSDSPNAVRYEGLRRLSAERLRAEFDEQARAFISEIRLEFDAHRAELDVRDVDIPPIGDPELPRISTVSLRGTVPSQSRVMTWALDPRFGASVIRARQAAEESPHYARYVAAGAVSEPVALRIQQERDLWSVFREYLAVGYEHIVPKGLDHILFVIGLFLLSPRLGALLWQVTSFTVAHSVTLALAVAGVVQVSPAVVEPLIAASIVYVAVENLATDKLKPWRPLVVFGFGLIHGLGFAGVITEVGLAPGHLLIGLFAFNVGVELGQLAVIAGCFLAIGVWARDKSWYRKAITMPASVAVASVGAYWFVERIL